MLSINKKATISITLWLLLILHSPPVPTPSPPSPTLALNVMRALKLFETDPFGGDLEVMSHETLSVSDPLRTWCSNDDEHWSSL